MTTNDGKTKRATLGFCLIPFVGAASVLAAFHVLGRVRFHGFSLDLGTTTIPSVGYLSFVLVWIPFGTVAAILISKGVQRLHDCANWWEQVERWWNSLSDRRFLIFACVIAFLVPLLIDRVLMKGSPIADDESAYRFAAELLASGRLWVMPFPSKMFFDQNFIINDSRMFTAYFLGWPALLVPAVLIGVPWVANPLYSALTIPPLFAIIRQSVGAGWARAGILLFLSSPFIQIAAATDLSHTSCLMALTWCLFMFIRTYRRDASAWDHAGFAAFFSMAFWIRPQTALALGLPLLVLWTFDLFRRGKCSRRSATIGFAVPCAVLASLFLLTLWIQNGSPWVVSYMRYNQYLIENNFAFSTFRPEHLTGIPGFIVTSPLEMAIMTTAGLVRLNSDLFGWPSSFALAFLAIKVRTSTSRILWAMLMTGLTSIAFHVDWGIDTFGPVHAFELSLPILVLSIIGAQNLQSRIRRPLGAASLLLGFIVAAQLGFVPVRLKALGQITAHVAKALNAPERANIHDAVVFAPTPFAPPCGEMPRHFVFFRPVNDPDLRRDILWVNDISPSANQAFLQTMNGREGFLMRWSDHCDVELFPVARKTPS